MDNIEKLHKRLEEQSELIRTNQEHINIILREVIGQNSYGNKAYKDRILDNENNIENLENKIDRQEARFNNIYSKVVGICIGVSIAASSIGFLIKNSIVKTEKSSIGMVKEIPSVPVSNPPADYTEPLRRAIKEQDINIKTD